MKKQILVESDNTGKRKYVTVDVTSDDEEYDFTLEEHRRRQEERKKDANRGR